MSESTSEALDYLRAERVPDVVPDVKLSPDIEAVISAADEVDRKLPHPPPVPVRKGFTVTERLDGVTLAAMRELMARVV